MSSPSLSILTPAEETACHAILPTSPMFRYLSDVNLHNLCKKMKKRIDEKGNVLIKSGELDSNMYAIVSGEVQRSKVDHEGAEREVDIKSDGSCLNALHVVPGDPVYATARCVSPTCTTLVMSGAVLRQALSSNPDLSVEIITGLNRQLRAQTKTYHKLRQPMLDATPKELNKVNVSAVSVAAGIESYYRSALNSMINQRLTGHKGTFFPNMHVQVPTRVCYIVGFKALRSYITYNFHPLDYGENAKYVRILMAVAPGVIMTPLSSLLEASTAGHMNSEPLQTRWRHGYSLRTFREVIFGLGLNNMADYFDELFQPHVGSRGVATAVGSLVSGVLAGYISHVPHNLSAYKLLEPKKSYSEHFMTFVHKSVPGYLKPTIAEMGPRSALISSVMVAILFPRGCLVRTTQIVGSFIILNGTIAALQRQELAKFSRSFHEMMEKRDKASTWKI